MPFFLNPFAFTGLAAIPILIGIYYLRNRFKRRVVSSLMLWDGIIKSNEGGQKKDRLQLPWMFFLELFGLVALAFAATQPFVKTSSSRIPATIVLDDSYSMLATPTGNSNRSGADDQTGVSDLGKSVRDRVIESLMEMSKSNTYEFDLILAGQSPRRLGEKNITDSAALTAALDEWTCEQSSSNLFEAVEVVKKIHGPEHRILVCTDQAPADKAIVESDSRLRWISFGKPMDNTAITFASRKQVLSDTGAGEKLLVRIESFSEDPTQPTKRRVNSSIKIIDAENNRTVVESPFQLTADTKKEIILELPESVAKRDLRLEIDADTVTADNQLFLLAEEPIEIDVYLNLDDVFFEKIWKDALQVIPNVKINEASPSVCDIVITDTEFVLQPEQWHIFCPPQKAPVAFAGPYAVSAEHPLVKGLPIRGAIWAADADKREITQSNLAPKPNAPSASPKSLVPDSNPKNKKANGANADSGKSKPNRKGSNRIDPPSDQDAAEPEIPKNESGENNSDTSPDMPSNSRIRSVIRAGQTGLIIDHQLSQLRRRIELNLQPKYSTVSSSQPTWIVLIVNLIEWRKKYAHGPEFVNTWQNTQSARFPLDTETISLTGPDQSTKVIPVINGLAQIEMIQGGLWNAKIESSRSNPEPEKSSKEENSEIKSDEENKVNSQTNSETEQQTTEWKWSFYPLSARESNLQKAETTTIDNWRELDVNYRSIYQPAAWLLGLLAFGLFITAFVFQHQAK